MMESAIAGGLILLFMAVGLAQAVPWPELMAAGFRVMMAAAMVGVPLQFLYYLAMWACLRRNASCPAGWYWRAFESHGMLSPVQYWVVVPVFMVGAGAFAVIVLSMGIIVIAGVVGMLEGG